MAAPGGRVVELIAGEDCAVTAIEIDRRLERVGRASVYRALEQLEELDLIRRVDLGGDSAGYERVDPGGDHHHHLLCERCGAVAPFSDERSRERSNRSAGPPSSRYPRTRSCSGDNAPAARRGPEARR